MGKRRKVEDAQEVNAQTLEFIAPAQSRPTETMIPSTGPLSAIAVRKALAAQKAAPNIRAKPTTPPAKKAKKHETPKAENESVIGDSAKADRLEDWTAEEPMPSAESGVDLEIEQGIIEDGADLEPEDETDTAEMHDAHKYSRSSGSYGEDPLCASTFQPSESNARRIQMTSGVDSFIVGLHPEETICFQGVVKVIPVKGSFEIAGHMFGGSHGLTEQPFQQYFCYSPKTHPLLRIIAGATREASAHRQGQSRPLTNEVTSQLSSMLAEHTHFIDAHETVLLLQSSVSNGIHLIESMPAPFRGIFSKIEGNNEASQDENGTTGASIDIAGFHMVTKPILGRHALEHPDHWHTSMQKMISEDRGFLSLMICGSKDMGKSTFARFAVNRLLNTYRSVAFLETDVGQSEFSLPGCVSLHVLEGPILGPPFTHLHLQPIKSHFIGAIAPKEDPDHYSSCILDLYNIWKTDLVAKDSANPIPLVINTNGWVKGLGLDILASIVQQIGPTHVATMFSPHKPARNLSADIFTSRQDNHQLASTQYTPEIHNIVATSDVSIGTTSTLQKHSAHDHRLLSFLSYFHLNTRSFSNAEPQWNFTKPPLGKVPYVADWSSDHWKGVWILFEDVRWSQLLYALNGTLVALIGDYDDSEAAQSTPMPANGTHAKAQDDGGNQVLPPQYFPPSRFPPPPPALTTCYGYGVIRAIDLPDHRFHLVTPLSLQTIRKVNGLVRGTVDIPISLMLADANYSEPSLAGIPWEDVPYMKDGGVESVGGGVLKVRRNLMRRGQQA
ncbi:hypothetical protein BZG36_01468 [Bifiguratus adelaidae]|uniref:Polynucleotide 5'-hydroxyl-kinase GRC3 n=1 Tax=Bifiguratus adelaidae TaxID=1938954 RepID=A0A261Y4R8_9FUNG|nr:hypothetical protein BZG36_01468 [Bifiguratus adelaidae]